MKKTIIVTDDHPIVLEGLKNVLLKQGYNVITASSAPQTLMLAQHTAGIDLFVIDLSLHKSSDGLNLLASLREGGFRQPAIIYTMHDELWNIAALTRADVEGIVLKGDDINELTTAITTVLAGQRYRSNSFDNHVDEVTRAKGILSEKDIEVLRLLGRGCNSKVIATEIGMSEKSVEYHRTNILRKLDCRNMTEAMGRAVRMGILMPLLLAAVMPAAASEPATDVTRPVAVDLGLSVMWADRNLGADSPLAAGNFYAFGETEPKDYYDWSTYQHCVDGQWMNQTDIGDESIAGTSFDPAFTDLGEGWRLPLNSEIEELLANTECVSYAADSTGIPYCRLTAANGASIDFPLVGYMSLGRIVHDRKQSALWSGTFYVEAEEEDGESHYINCPFMLGVVKDSDPVVVEGSAQLGLSVRPVYTATQSIQPAIATDRTLPTLIYTTDGRRVHTPVNSLRPGLYIVREGNTVRKLRIVN